MKKLGLLGGMGPESTVPYYHGIVYGVQKRLGRQQFPTLTVESVDVFHIMGLLNDKKYDELVEYLSAAINCLVRAGADFVAMSANTPHIIFDRLQELSPVRILSIVEATRREAEQRNYKRLGLLGTIFTMTNNFFKTPFEKAGIRIVTPNDEEMAFINDKIYNEIELGIINEDTKSAFVKIIGRLKEEAGIEAVILGCTELPLLLNDALSPVPCLDTMQIHIDEITTHILSSS